MIIRPGYDFTTTEVPTKAKLQRMLSQSTVEGIDISQISTNLVGTKIAESSVSLPAEGWLWRDPMGCLWVNTGRGPAKLFSGDRCGLETRRYPTGAPNINPPVVSDKMCYVAPGGKLMYVTGWAPSGVTLESNVFFTAISTSSGVGSERFKNLETAPSGAYVRFKLFGICDIPCNGQYSLPSYIGNGGGANYWDANCPIPYSNPSTPVNGVLCGAMSDTPYSSMTMRTAYMFGQPLPRLS